MGTNRELLAIRTILVGTRAAVHSHRRAEQPELERMSLERGLELLDHFLARHPNGLSPEAEHAFEDARRELRGLVETAASDEAPISPAE
jgi:hypothetical protein